MSPAPSFSDNSAPLLLTSSVEVAAGSTAECDSEALSVPFRKPAVIDEIRWTVRHPYSVAWDAWNPGGIIGCRLSLGGIDLTNKFMPIWLLGAPIQDVALTEQNLADGTFGSTPVWFSSFRWKLPVPLEVQTGMALRAEISRAGSEVLDNGTTQAGPSGDISVDVAFAGRYLGARAKISRSIRVPYATAFLSPRGQAYAESGEKDLWNPFTVPLNVQRFVGRLEQRITPPNGASVQEDIGSLYAARVRMHDSVGNTITKGSLRLMDTLGAILSDGDPLFYGVFEGARRSWTFSRQLAAKEQYYATVSGLQNGTEDGVFTNAQIALIGWRDVEVNS